VELFGVAGWALVVMAVAVAVGAAVQGSVGLGLGLVAAPTTALVVCESVFQAQVASSSAHPRVTRSPTGPTSMNLLTVPEASPRISAECRPICS